MGKRLKTRRARHPLPSDHPRFTFDVKGWLIFFNLQLDALLADIAHPRWPSSLTHEHEIGALAKLTLLLEDRYYLNHSGIDLRAMGRVLKQLVKRQRIGGVSTIEQQYVRTYLNRRERTVGRKVNELILAWLIGHRAGKLQILHTYLGSAYFGYRLNGCDRVSRLIFNKPALELTTEEAALVASLLVYPMPKAISAKGMEENWLPTQNIADFLSRSGEISEWWAGRVRRRMQFGLRILSDTEETG